MSLVLWAVRHPRSPIVAESISLVVDLLAIASAAMWLRSGPIPLVVHAVI